MELFATASLQEHQKALLTLLEEFDRVCKQLKISYVLFAGTMLGAVRHKGIIPWDDDLDVLMMRRDYNRFLNEAETVLNKDRFFLQKEFSEHWPMFFSKLRLNNTACIEKYHPKDSETHQGVYIDLFPCDNAFNNGFGRKLQFLASKVVIAKSLSERGYETDSKKKKAFMCFCKILPRPLFLKLTQGGSEESEYVHTFLGAASSFQKNIYSRKCFDEIIEFEFEGREYPISAKYDELLTTMYGDYMELPPPEERTVKQHAVLVDLERSYEEYKDYHKNLEFDVYTRSIR
ncbi:MAG: LicD family protein [Ruminococcaceae bacterium]|nr:LicD family protein [Oscillospiraceae bacterium]